MLKRFIRVHQNPWDHTVPDDQLTGLILAVADRRAEHVARQFDAGIYARDSLALAILNPAAPLWQPSSETLLATIAIGPEGERFVANAIAKAVEHRDHGLPGGYGVYVDLTQSADGDFCYGYSTQVDGTIGGASGQTELQDACEAGHALVTFNYYIREARKKWAEMREAHPHWFCNLDEPGELYSEMANRPGEIYDGFR
ncbi:hypothetical protein HY857_00495 [Candidatus Saccharibacteria bacterium]|nr:hypothetical protein [Candidatus Saccharibacteria bacterium]